MYLKKAVVHGYNLTIVLPRDYDSTQHYPTIYMQDGGNGAQQALNYIEHLILSKQIKPFILIGIEPINRNDDYTPWPAEPFFPNAPKLGGKAKDYLNILVTEIKPYIDEHYATNPAPNYTTIGGCSFGGLLTVFASYYFPEIFGNYIVLSASFWYEDVVNYLEGQSIVREDGQSFTKPTIKREDHKMYGYVGELEGIYHQTTQKNMFPLTKKAFAALRLEGFTEENFRFETHPEGTHDAYFFTTHFLHALRWLDKNRN